MAAGRRVGESLPEREKRLSVCLSSAASIELFPDNSQTRFVNQLPRPVRNRERRKHFVRLKAVGMVTETEDPERLTSGAARIAIYELEEQAEGVHYTRHAITFPFPPEEGSQRGYGYTVFRHPPQLPLRFQSLERLHVQVVDREGKTLRLQEGPPTLLWLEISDMGDEDDFVAVCDSRQTSYFPGNRLDNFTVPLPKEFTLEDCEVALLNVIFPPMMEEENTAEIAIDGRRLAFDLNSYLQVHNFLDDVKTAVRDEFGSRLTFGVLSSGRPFLYHARGRDRAPVTVRPSPAFTKACGQVGRPRALTSLAPGKSIIFEGKPNLHYGRHHPVAMLHCDLVQSNVQCGKEAPFVQCVPLIKRTAANMSRMYEPAELTYHPVRERPFNTINFRFVEPDGEERRFTSKNPKDSVSVTLSFRRRKR